MQLVARRNWGRSRYHLSVSRDSVIKLSSPLFSFLFEGSCFVFNKALGRPAGPLSHELLEMICRAHACDTSIIQVSWRFDHGAMIYRGILDGRCLWMHISWYCVSMWVLVVPCYRYIDFINLCNISLWSICEQRAWQIMEALKQGMERRRNNLPWTRTDFCGSDKARRRYSTSNRADILLQYCVLYAT